MKQRVTAYVGKTYFWWDYESHEEQDAKAKCLNLIARGFEDESKAGVVTYYLPHRITRITRRWVK